MASAEEQEAFLWLQGRMVQLLLRHDVQRLGKSFAGRLGTLFDDARHGGLRPYRELAVLVYLRDELLESILPRIKRRLSFLAPRELLEEELPPRGRIDWPRTMASSLRDWPGEPPLEVKTRQRRRHFATPENLLTVTTILEYQGVVQAHLDSELAERGGLALRHPLHEIVERCTRELAFPQFVGLVRSCEHIVAGYSDQTPADLERAVEEQLLPGRNSAYDDLLAWRRNLAALRLLDRPTADASPPMLGADPARDNYLYQLWLFYEIAELLAQRGVLEGWSVGEMRLRFRWGEGDDTRVYRLQHDRAIPHHWKLSPGVRPDLYLERDDRDEVRHGGELIWREPGYVLDAKYYKPRDSARAPAGTVKRMIADLHLTGERHGALLFAFQSGERAADGDDVDVLDQLHETPLAKPRYRVVPETAAAQVARPDAAIAIWRTRPAIDMHAVTDATLSAVLEEAHQALRTRVPVACHGIFLDSLSASERTALVGSDGQLLADPDDILICPKPHVGPWRADLVSRTRTCCKDPRLCHVMGNAAARPPVRPPRTAEDLLKELQQIFDARDLDMLDEDAIDAVARRIEEVTLQFARITGALKNLAAFEKQLGDAGFDRTLQLLGVAERETLALAIYLRDQLDQINARDYSAPIIHVARALERELQRRILAVPGVSAADFPHYRPTLGSLAGVRDKNPVVWGRIRAHLGPRWQATVDHEDPAFQVDLNTFVDHLATVVKVRNQAAHTTPVSRDEYRRVFRHVCGGSSPLRVGALNVLLLAWST